MRGLPSNLFYRLKDQDIVFLEKAISYKKSRKPYHLKALRSDGAHAHFF